MLDVFALETMRFAAVATALVGFVASYFGVFIVQRRMAFLGSGLAHAAFGGVALGIFLDAQPLITAVPFTVAAAIAIVWLRERSALAEDTVIGVLFAVAMALGIIFIQLRPGYVGDANVYLFGSVLWITRTDVYLAGTLAAGTVCTAPLWGAWAYASFDRNLAKTDRLRVAWHDYALACAMAVVIVVSMKIIGMLLIAAFLVIPAATARLLSHSFRVMTLLSIAIGSVTPVFGFFLAHAADVPPGAMIILVQAILFFAALAVRKRS
ncbi:MAG TPA: metal ABC transporter permease [Candidatus Hydrogenedentes bacterium]|nr:metal ABC transporter permease [Candidatus Hydrogenedentota bacterium]